MSDGRLFSKQQKSPRGFQFLTFVDANGLECELLQSSATDNTERGLNQPGSSFVRLGREGAGRMHLHRDHVKELIGVLDGWLKTGSLEALPNDECLPRSVVLELIEAEPEFPDPCPNLRTYISDAVKNNDQEWILHLMRQTVRATKDSIAARISAANETK